MYIYLKPVDDDFLQEQTPLVGIIIRVSQEVGRRRRSIASPRT
jgi:hypothetical protein